MTRSFDVFFDLRLNKRLNKQSWGWWWETISRPLWRHHNDVLVGSEEWTVNRWWPIGNHGDLVNLFVNVYKKKKCIWTQFWRFFYNDSRGRYLWKDLLHNKIPILYTHCKARNWRWKILTGHWWRHALSVANDSPSSFNPSWYSASVNMATYTAVCYGTPNRTLMPIFWYQKFDFLISKIIFWYQKIGISDNRNSIFWYKKIISDIRYRISDIRKCMNFWYKNRTYFLISEND